jgi:O-acetyl-ADP-ribose deacetylase (regulator of RNase III)
MPSQVRALLADITSLDVDAIVNAANTTLLGGGGVDGAIHEAAGPELLKECRRLGGCPTGEVRITQGYRLKAKRIIHAVGPVWRGGSQGEAEQLASCYERSLELASQHNLRSIVFPSISTGAYGYPLESAAQIAVGSVRDFLNRNDTLEVVVFCCFSDHDLDVYEKLLRRGRA